MSLGGKSTFKSAMETGHFPMQYSLKELNDELDFVNEKLKDTQKEFERFKDAQQRFGRCMT